MPHDNHNNNNNHGNGARVFLICGSGGVGKTTVAAALGLKLAAAGKKTAVLTIDPAKRLATSLGLSELSDEPRLIETGRNGGRGELFAMMLDTKRTFDRLVERYAPTPQARDNILGNRLYQHLSSMLAGSQEYMAMERLYELHKRNGYEAIVVDTPPMQNAIDFLEAPDRLANMIGNSMIHLLLKPTLALSRTGFKFFEKGARTILNILDRIVGFAFLQDISGLLIAFQGLLGGFEARAREVRALLQNESTTFLTVCTTEGHSVAETRDFAKRLSELGCRHGGIVVNRVYPFETPSRDRADAELKALERLVGTEGATRLTANYRRHLPLMRRDARQTAVLAKIAGRLAAVPLFLSDVHDVEGLRRIASYLPAC